MLRSILAVLAGYLILAVGIGLVDFGISRVSPEHYPGGPDPVAKWMVVELIIGLALLVLGGYVTVSIARHALLKHALALGVLTSLIAAVSLIIYHGRQPFWFQAVMVVGAIPAALAGGKLRAGH